MWLSVCGQDDSTLAHQDQQHLPPANKNSKNKSSSSICTHLQSNPECFDMFDKSSFSVLCKARTESVLHTLEALFIKNLSQSYVSRCSLLSIYTCSPDQTPTYSSNSDHMQSFTHLTPNSRTHSVNTTC